MHADDLDAADRALRLAFGTIRGLPDPSATFGDADSVRTRFRAAPECAWAAELDGDVVGSVFAARWGSFGFFGPLSVHPDLWDRGIGGRLLRPVLEAFAGWDVRQAGLFTFADSPKHLGLYQKHGFWPGALTVVAAKDDRAVARRSHELFSEDAESSRDAVLDEIRGLTDQVFRGLDLGREIAAVLEQGIGDTVVVRTNGALEGMAVCHCRCRERGGQRYVLRQVRRSSSRRRMPRRGSSGSSTRARRSRRSQGLSRLVAGVNTGRLDAYRRLLARGFRAERIGVAMRLRPEGPHFDTPTHYVIDDLR